MIKGSKRELKLRNECIHCKNIFACADPKASICEICKGCKFCGKLTRAKSRTCRKCSSKYPSNKRLNQLKILHQNMIGENNPSKRPEVKEKLSKSKLGDLNPARKYPQQYKEHIAKYRPGKVSKLELLVADAVPDLIPQYKIAWYTIDFVDIDKKIALEIQGCWYHSCNKCFPTSPDYKTQIKVSANDKRKKSFLEKNGWKVIEIWEHDIRSKSSTEDLCNFCKTSIK